jgi:hypothetical protein
MGSVFDQELSLANLFILLIVVLFRIICQKCPIIEGPKGQSVSGFMRLQKISDYSCQGRREVKVWLD